VLTLCKSAICIKYDDMTNDMNTMTTNSGKTFVPTGMIRGLLPLAWLAGIVLVVTLYIVPNDPNWLKSLRHATYLMLILLAIITYFLGIPSKREFIAGSATGLFGVCAVIATAALFSVWLFLIAAFFVIIPLSNLMFHRLSRLYDNLNQNEDARKT